MKDCFIKLSLVAALFGGTVEAVDFNYQPSVYVPLREAAEYGIETFLARKGEVLVVTVQIDNDHGDICEHVDVIVSTYRQSVFGGKDVVPVPMVVSGNEISLRVRPSEYTSLRVHFLCDDENDISSYTLVFDPEQKK